MSASTSFLGFSRSFEASNAAQHQASSQYQNHDVAGTLVITAGCTHKDAVLLAPFVLLFAVVPLGFLLFRRNFPRRPSLA